ncbi:hypothetical protein ACX9CO_002546 [Vibrio parahaemolyticus]|uniref:hypothetical protein n=1 Tax=Vibrio diabolicus TaxID=50719 RepID=UPI001DDB653D|nr:hypothetical protein [Vibrio diabolicus]EGR0528301.1 hypothetical protein [Vibrio parahaemolyticus]EGR0561296.1 hypothetical protein [Vibrio parahaemolyticus]EHK0726813.1 hypothetical protein [Vibrio parahaemolyticus]EJF9952017.1 hypothetical protein [Vibrio parahaemolyticus]EKI0386351.1 hypothetical protein [Vibrio parahaemolyticus]
MKKEEFDLEHLMSVHYQPVVEAANEKRREIAEAMNSFAFKDSGEDERKKLMPQALAVIKEAQEDYIRSGQITNEIEQCFKTIFGEDGGQFVIEEIKRIADEEWQGRKDALILIGELYKKHQLEEENHRLEKQILHIRKKTKRDTLFSAKHRLKERKLKLEPEVCDTLLDWFAAVESEDKNKVFDASRSLLPVLSQLISSGKGFALGKGQGRPKKPTQDIYVYSEVFGDVSAADKYNFNVLDRSRIRQIRSEWESRYSGKDLELFKAEVISNILDEELLCGYSKFTMEEVETFFVYLTELIEGLG